MRKLVLLLSILFTCNLVSFAQSFSSGLRHGGTGSDITRATTTDAQNNFYSLVFYYNALTIDSAGTPVTIPNAGNRDIAVIKYNCNKVYQWAIHIGGTQKEGGDFNNSGLVVDTLGNLYVTSTFNGSAIFSSANGLSQGRTAYGGYDGFVLRANAAGSIQWINLIGSTGNDESEGIAIDRDGSVYVTGLFYTTGNFTSTSGPVTTRVSLGSSDIFVSKYTSSGVLVYALRGGAALQDNCIGIDVDSSGNAYVAGGWGCCGNSTAAFGANNLTNTSNWGAIIAKVDPAGNWLWANGAGTNNFEAFADVVVDEVYDRVYVIGHFNGPTTISTRPPGTAVALATNGNYDAMIAAMDLNGALLWARAFGSSNAEYGLGVDLDRSRNPVFTGEFDGTTNFGGITLTPTNTSSAYYAKYSRTNVLMDAQKVGTGTTAQGWDIHTSTTGVTYVTGYYTGTTVLGTSSLVSGGIEDGFVAAMQDADTTILNGNKALLNCLADTAILYVSNKRFGNFVWFKDGVVLTATNGNEIKTTAPGVYSVIAANFCSTLDTSNTFTVTRSPYYTLTPISDLKICAGDSAQFAASGGTTYRWFPGTGLSDTTVANPFVKATVATNYRLTVTQGACTAFDTINVAPQANCCLTCSTPYGVSQGLVACFPFTGNANDESGNNNNATVINALATTDRFGIANRAYQFNGASSYLEVPNSPSLASPTTKVSFTFWAQINNWLFNAGVNYTPILSKSNSLTAAQYRGMIRSDGVYGINNGQNWTAAMGSTTNLTTWYFFAIVMSNDTIRYYRNGVLLGFATGPTPITLASTTPLRIGRNDVNTLAFFNGRLDEVRVYNRSLSAAEVTKLYNLSAINGMPTINAGTDKNICVGDSAYISPAGTNGVFMWTPGRGLNDSTVRNVYAHPDTTTRYIVSVDISGCKNRDTVMVNAVRFEPYAGMDQSICNGDSLQLNVLNGGATYAWTPNYNITTTTSPTPQVFPTVDTSYIVLTNNGLCAKRDTIRVTVNTPTINAGMDKDICKGDTAYIGVITNGTARWSPFTYLNDSIGTNMYSVADTTIRYVVTTNYLGCLARDTVQVNVVSLPIDGGPDKILCLGDSVQLHATGGGSNYIWLPNYNISDTTIADPWVWPTINTKYFVVSYNLLCARFDSVKVFVKTASANAGSDITICNGDSTQLHATVIGPYTWNNTGSLGDTSLQPYARPTVTTEYILRVNNFGCIDEDTVKVGIVDFNINGGTDKTICIGDSVQLGPATGATKFSWLPVYNINDTGIANPYVHPTGPTNYYVFAANGICIRHDTVHVDVQTLTASAGTDTSMCVGANVKLQPSGGTIYQWLTSYNISNQNIPDPVVTPAIDTAYVVRINNGGVCNVYDTVKVKVNVYPIVNAGPDLRHCPGEAVQLQASASNYTQLSWNPGAGLTDKLIVQPFASVTSQTTYVLGAFNGYCFSSDTVVVTPNPQVKANFSFTPDDGTAPVEVTFTNKSLNAYFFSWLFGVGNDGSSLPDPVYTYTDEGQFTVTLYVQDSLGCKDSLSYTINTVAIDHIFAPNAFSPNKDDNNDEFRMVYNASKFEFVECEIFNRWGVKIYQTRMPGGSWWNGTLNGQACPPELYTYVVKAKSLKGKIFKLEGTIALIR